MKTLKMTDNWDLKMQNKKIETIQWPMKASQDIKMILKTIKGNNIFYENMGVAWIPVIRNPSKANIEDAILDALRQYNRAITVQNIKISEGKNRKIDVRIKIKVEDVTREIMFSIGE